MRARCLEREGRKKIRESNGRGERQAFSHTEPKCVSVCDQGRLFLKGKETSKQERRDKHEQGTMIITIKSIILYDDQERVIGKTSCRSWLGLGSH